MGQPSALRGLVGKFQKLDGNKIDVQGQIEKAKKAVQESIQKTISREEEVDAFLAQKNKERAIAADLAYKRIRDLEQKQ